MGVNHCQYHLGLFEVCDTVAMLGIGDHNVGNY